MPRADLATRLASSPFHYFRFINTEFSQLVCRRFESVLSTMPTVNLHGDAHLEQFAVTTYSAGLHDFDDSVNGPPVIDLVRFGVSIKLALDQRGWSEHADRAIDAWLASYTSTLDAGTAAASMPAVVEKLRARFNASNDQFLAWAESQMNTLGEPLRSRVVAGHERYVDLMLRIQPERTRAFFALKKFGALRTGIGSARGARLLARIEGETPSPSDDIVLEAKEVRDLSAVPCIQSQRGDALRVVAGSATFGRRPDPFLAVIPRAAEDGPDDPPWWIQSWSAQYGEVDIDETFENVDELIEVAVAVGIQMASGHVSRMRPPYDQQLAALIRGTLSQHGALIRQVIDELTLETRRAHAHFRERQSK